VTVHPPRQQGVQGCLLLAVVLAVMLVVPERGGAGGWYTESGPRGGCGGNYWAAARGRALRFSGRMTMPGEF